MSKTMTVQNQSGQVASFDVDGPFDPRAQILQQRIDRGELKVVDAKTESTRTTVVVEDVHTGMTDEKGDYLKSVHGGGADPDALGDALGVPSGSGKDAKDVEADRKFAADAAAAQADAAAPATPRKRS